MQPRFFRSPAELARWFARHHARERELWVGFHKRGSGVPSLSWPESVDEALCVGWIDGLRRALDETRYAIRFSPRKPGSIWSAVNLRRARALLAAGRLNAAGRRAFEARRENRVGRYSYEQRRAELPELHARELARHARARSFFEAQSPSYRKKACWYVVSAKKEETRAARLARLIALWSRGDDAAALGLVARKR